MMTNYDFKNCQSLFGYAEEVHKRSGGICQLCDCGSAGAVDFDLWRQFTVEHLIGKTQKGYWDDIYRALQKRFPSLTDQEIETITNKIDSINTITACSFCNSTTSRDRHSVSMETLIEKTKGGVDRVIERVERELQKILKRKQRKVKWKLQSVRKAFEKQVKPSLAPARERVHSKK